MPPEDSKREKLERLLETVQDIKEEYYVGTLEAYNAAKARACVYEYPAILSGHVNGRLAGEAIYKATPERLAGACSLISLAENHIFGSKDLLAWFHASRMARRLGINVYSDFGNLLDGWRSAEYAIFGFYANKESANSKESEFKEKAFLFFNEANKSNVTNDEDFKKFVARNVCDTLGKYLSENSPPKLKASRLNIVEEINSLIYRARVEEIFSKSNLSVRERGVLFSIDCKYLDIAERIERLQNDMVEHRLEYRRNILATYLRQFYRSGHKEDMGWEEIVLEHDTRLKTSLSRLKILNGLSAPEEVIHQEDRIVNRLKFMRHLLGSEKNFAIKFLTS